MKDLIEGYLKSLKADGKSKHTIENYGRDLQRFARYFEGVSVESIDYPMMRNWANSMAEEGLKAGTRARMISTVRSFYRYLYRLGIVIQSPAEALERPKIEAVCPVVISGEEAHDLIENTKFSRSDLLWNRDYTIMSMFLYTGIRREELTNIKLCDVDLEKKVILIHGKGCKQRIVVINSKLFPVLKDYIQYYRKRIITAGESDYLFPSIKSVKMAVNSVNHVVNKAMEETGIKKKGVSAHVLRKRFATTVFDKTGDIGITSKMLGHSSPTVTMRYVVMEENQMRKAAESLDFTREDD